MDTARICHHSSGEVCYSKITAKIGLKTNCYISHLLEGDFGAIAMKDVAKSVELTCNQRSLVAISLDRFPSVSAIRQRFLCTYE